MWCFSLPAVPAVTLTTAVTLWPASAQRCQTRCLISPWQQALSPSYSCTTSGRRTYSPTWDLLTWDPTWDLTCDRTLDLICMLISTTGMRGFTVLIVPVCIGHFRLIFMQISMTFGQTYTQIYPGLIKPVGMGRWHPVQISTPTSVTRGPGDMEHCTYEYMTI